MGFCGLEYLYLMKQYFEQSINEIEYLEYMESWGGNFYWIDCFVVKYFVFIYYWSNVVYYWVFFCNVYYLFYEVEIYVVIMYVKYFVLNGYDDKIFEILNDELYYLKELNDVMEMINV